MAGRLELEPGRREMIHPGVVGSGRSPVSPPPSDHELMARIRAGEEAALQLLVERYWSPLLLHVSRSLPADDAVDVAQEVFVRVWNSRQHWSPAGEPRAFLYQVARNLTVDRLRHLQLRRRTEPVLRSELDEEVISPMQQAADRELLQALEAAVQVLPPRRREAFVLVRMQGLSLDKTAEAMRLSRQTVANHVSLALSDLAKALGAFRT